MLPVSLDCSFVIVPSVLSNVYLPSTTMNSSLIVLILALVMTEFLDFTSEKKHMTYKMVSIIYRRSFI